jgi:hypothetical protein
MFNLLLASGFNLWKLDLWYAIPAIIAVSLVYAATRHEEIRPILTHAGRVAIWITGFMTAVFVVIAFVSWLI